MRYGWPWGRGIMPCLMEQPLSESRQPAWGCDDSMLGRAATSR